MSPYEATVLKTPPADKVQGKRLMHFWVFFDRPRARTTTSGEGSTAPRT